MAPFKDPTLVRFLDDGDSGSGSRLSSSPSLKVDAGEICWLCLAASAAAAAAVMLRVVADGRRSFNPPTSGEVAGVIMPCDLYESLSALSDDPLEDVGVLDPCEVKPWAIVLGTSS